MEGPQRDSAIAASSIMNAMLDAEGMVLEEDGGPSTSSAGPSQSKSAQLTEPVLIAVYNYKGGVGKTTTTINLGAALADLGYKTLIVDADTQCNLSSYFIRGEVQDDGDEEDDSTDDDDDDGDQTTDKDDNDAVEGEGDGEHSASSQGEQQNSASASGPSTSTRASRVVDVRSVSLAVDIASPQTADMDLRADNTQPSLYSVLEPAFLGNVGGLRPPAPDKLHHIRERLFLLPGSTRLIEFEAILGFSELRSNPAGQYLLGSFRKVLTETARDNGMSFVIIDLGPSSGLLNRVFAMSCNYILPTAFADRMSLCSTDGLLKVVLPAWVKWFQDIKDLEVQRISAHPQFKPFEFVARPPSVLPVIVTTYRIYTPRKGHAKGSRQALAPKAVRCLAEGPSTWLNSLRQLMASITGGASPLTFVSFNGSFVLPLVQDLGQLITKHAGKQRKAVIDASVTGRASCMRTYARLRYAGLASALVTLCAGQ